LFASTNYPDKLDAALRRPGRFDVHIAFDHAVHEQAVDLFKHFYPLSRIQHDQPTDTKEKEKRTEKSAAHPFKDQKDLDQAADQFADCIMSKNIKVSIATIQGFLLLYKKDPVMALEKVEEWAEGIRKEQFPDVQVVEGDHTIAGVEKLEVVDQEMVEQETEKQEQDQGDKEIEKDDFKSEVNVVLV
jgi:SpoVK/Ycf46/Vps4 family AAA+-type ATPase